MITYGVSRTPADLRQILALQQANLPKTISATEAEREGFVTAEHNFDLLQQMNIPYPHIVARANGVVIAYALVMLRALADAVPVLVPMFQIINKINYKGKALRASNYLVMGQICVGKVFRGQGVFRGLYGEMQKRLSPHFDYLLTEIDAKNTRSIRAHQRVGFEDIHTYTTNEGTKWVIVLLPLSTNIHSTSNHY